MLAKVYLPVDNSVIPTELLVLRTDSPDLQLKFFLKTENKTKDKKNFKKEKVYIVEHLLQS